MAADGGDGERSAQTAAPSGPQHQGPDQRSAGRVHLTASHGPARCLPAGRRGHDPAAHLGGFDSSALSQNVSVVLPFHTKTHSTYLTASATFCPNTLKLPLKVTKICFRDKREPGNRKCNTANLQSPKFRRGLSRLFVCESCWQTEAPSEALSTRTSSSALCAHAHKQRALLCVM